MTKAYLIARLNVKVFPPIVDRVMISSNTPGSMVDGPWLEIHTVEGTSFQDASDLLRHMFDSPLMRTYFPFVHRFLDASKHGQMEEVQKQCLAAESAVRMVEILNTPAVKL